MNLFAAESALNNAAFTSPSVISICTHVNLFVAESVLSDAAFTAPVEAEHSETVGGGALTICGFELIFVLILDADHFMRCFCKSKKLIQKHAKKQRRDYRISRISKRHAIQVS